MRPHLLVCDLDNTLYDWVGFFVPSFYAMVDKAIAILGCDRDLLLDDLKEVHQRYHDSEHPFALLETNTVQRLLGTLEIREQRQILDPAFKAFNTMRKQTLRLYPGVELALEQFQRAGIKLVAHSESRLYAVMFRLRFLSLTHFFERIYCIERPTRTLADEEQTRASWSDFPMSKLVELSHDRRKPSPEVLAEIFWNFDVPADNAAYVGDSIAKDIYMAKQAGSHSIWAEYGSRHAPEEYAKLVRVSHWTPEEIEYEEMLRKLAKDVRPDFTARESFSELLDYLN